MTLIATLHRDRAIPGAIEARNATGRIGGPWECLGKADNAKAAAHHNPSRDPLKKYGDTPTGIYTCSVGIAQANTRTFGPHPFIALAAKAGQCVRAVIEWGRTGFGLHGGDLNQIGKLRPTWGCLRVHNETMAEIHALAAEFGSITELIVSEE